VSRSRILFFVALIFSLSPWASPPTALLAGLVFAAIAVHPYPGHARMASKWLLQGSVVGLGFGMTLQQVLRAGRSGVIYTAVGILFALSLGLLLGRMMKVLPIPAFLISTGTAICGGSAIAAVGPVIEADDAEMSVSLGTVFILNSVALLTFPFIGKVVGLSQQQFGLWAALAIHDTSSVVGACAKYGAAALAVGTTVKLARALWIIPLSLGTAAFMKARSNVHSAKSARVQMPWFILFFVLAAVAHSYIAQGATLFGWLYTAGRIGLTVTLFLIGASLSPGRVRQVGPRPLLQGVTLWIIVAVVTLALIRGGAIGI
jgi:uncharacterized integral membrane protein (TIGR00698 family)